MYGSREREAISVKFPRRNQTLLEFKLLNKSY